MGEHPDAEHLGKSYHVSVMLAEAVKALDVRADGVYVDATFGGGGIAAPSWKGWGPPVGWWRLTRMKTPSAIRSKTPGSDSSRKTSGT